MNATPLTRVGTQAFSNAGQLAAMASLREIGAAFAATRDELCRQAGRRRSARVATGEQIHYVARDTSRDRGVLWMGATMNSEVLFRLGGQLG